MVNKNKVNFTLRIVISIGLLLFLLWVMRKGAKDVIWTLKNSNKKIFVLVFCLNTILTIVLSYRLKLLMLGQKIKLCLRDAAYLTFIGYFFNNFLPTAIGGDIAKAYYAAKKTNNKVGSFTAVVTDRLIGFLATLSIAMFGLFFISRDIKNTSITWYVSILFILSVMAAFFIFTRKKTWLQHAQSKKNLMKNVKEKILKLLNAVILYKDKPLLLIKVFILSLALQIATIFSIYLFILSVGGGVPLFRLFLIIPLVWAISMLPSLNGLGVREGAFVYFLKNYIGTEKAFSVSILWLGLIMLFGLAGGILHVLYPIKINNEERGKV